MSFQTERAHSAQRRFYKIPEREKQVTWQRSRMALGFSKAKVEARKQWSNVLKTMKENYFQSRIPYLAKLLIQWRNKYFSTFMSLKLFLSPTPFQKEAARRLVPPKWECELGRRYGTKKGDSTRETVARTIENLVQVRRTTRPNCRRSEAQGKISSSN